MSDRVVIELTIYIFSGNFLKNIMKMWIEVHICIIWI